jgi:hypothetical protein
MYGVMLRLSVTLTVLVVEERRTLTMTGIMLVRKVRRSIKAMFRSTDSESFRERIAILST